VALSSTTATCRSSKKSAGRSAGSSGLASSATVNQKLEPSPSRLSTPMVPPIISTRLLLIDSPSPLPPYLRVVEESACEKDWNSRKRLSSAMPMPVSRTVKRRPVLPAGASACSTATWISPSWVNFTALLLRLTTIWRRRTGSPRSRRGTPGATSSTTSRPLRWASRMIRSTASSSSLCRSKSMHSRLSLPASILEKSRMSFTRLSSTSAEKRTCSAYSRCSTSRPGSSSSSVMPVMVWIGVRISWLMFARNSLLARVVASADSLAFWRSTSLCFQRETSLTIPSRKRRSPAASSRWARFKRHQATLPPLR